jgi:hypothetical protein
MEQKSENDNYCRIYHMQSNVAILNSIRPPEFTFRWRAIYIDLRDAKINE